MSNIKTVKIYAHMSNESLYETGKKAGLRGDALNYFSHFNEVELEARVDVETGVVLSHRAVGRLMSGNGAVVNVTEEKKR